MKHINISLKRSVALLFAGFLLLVSSCSDFKDINVDPINPTKINPASQLVYVQEYLSGKSALHLRASAGIIYPFLQIFSGTFTNNSGATYAYSESIYSTVWKDLYPEVIRNIVDAIDKLKNDPDRTNLYAMFRIMKVYSYSLLTDFYGDIPYFEGAEGYLSLNTKPVYDKQEDIYNDFFKELEEASKLLDGSKDKVENDQYFHGDVEMWKKFANSLRLRLALRLVKVDISKAQTEAEKAIAAGVFEEGENCIIQNEDSHDIRGNALSNAMVANNYRIDTTFLNMLKPKNNSDPEDPRLLGYIGIYLSEPGNTGIISFQRPEITQQVINHYASLWPDTTKYAGLIGLIPGSTSIPNNPSIAASIEINVPGQGLVTVSHADQRARIAKYLTYDDQPGLILTYSEVAFHLAEAKVRGWNIGSAKSADELYKEGIKASIEQLSMFREVPDLADADNFVNSKTLTPGKELEEINNELYLSLFLNPWENFANWRRSGYPELVKPSGAQERSFVRRFPYPLNELQQNEINVKEAISRTTGEAAGDNSIFNRVWWDKE